MKKGDLVKFTSTFMDDISGGGMTQGRIYQVIRYDNKDYTFEGAHSDYYIYVIDDTGRETFYHESWFERLPESKLARAIYGT